MRKHGFLKTVSQEPRLQKKAGMFPVGILTINSEDTMKEAGSKLVFPTLLEAWQFLKKDH